MFSKKKVPENIKVPPALPETNQIKGNIGDVSRGGMRDVGIDIGPGNVPAPPVPPGRSGSRVREMPAPGTYEGPVVPARDSSLVLAGKKESPPLFIKIDRYRELAQNIRELKSNALSLRDALDALSDIEKELKNGLNITQMALDRFNSVVSLIDSKILRVGSEEDVVEVPREMDDYVKSLYDHVERIKHDLRTLKD